MPELLESTGQSPPVQACCAAGAAARHIAAATSAPVEVMAHGTRLVWIIYSTRQIVEVLTATERHFLTIDDTLSGGDVLPGFSVPVRDLFPVEDVTG